MLPRIEIVLPLALALVAFSTGAVAVNCGVCSPTIVYDGLARKLTLKRESESIVQCNYDEPSIAGFSPYCVYGNADGGLVYTNTGGACPSPVTVVSESSCA